MTIADPETPPAPAATEAAILCQQAAVLHKQGELEPAADLYRRALLVDPGNPDALHLLGMTHHQMGDNRMAQQLVKRAVTLGPYEAMFLNLGVISLAALDVEGAVAAYRHALTLNPDYVEAHQNMLFALDHYAGMTPELLLAERRAFNERFCAPLTRQVMGHANRPDPERKLRIGYVSGDFKLHSASMAFMGVLTNHDPKNFEVYLYSTPNDPSKRDQVTAELEAKADGWAEVSDLSDLELAELIRHDEVDILIDLSAFSYRGRMMAFARRPAPIQVTAWGYATGTGLDCMDYLVSDAVCVPPELEHLYTERIMRLPCLVAFDPGRPEDLPEIGPVPAEKVGAVTFGYLGRAVKLNLRVLEAWARILRAVPGSRLLLKGDEYKDEVFRTRISETLVAMGIDLGRLSILTSTSIQEHRATYNKVDVALDPWPAGGGMTTLEATLMGVPTVTMLGRTVPTRQAASIIGHVGLAPAGTTVEEYIDWAVKQAGDTERLAMYRRTLRPKLLGSAIVDRKGYCRAFERRLREAWRAWCREQKGRAT